MLQKLLLTEIKEHFRLNIYEVKIWTALLSRGVASAAELADISGVPRSRCYDVLESLEKKGFIIMKIGKPIRYIAVEPEAIIDRVKKDLETKAKQQAEFLEMIGRTDSFKELELLHKSGIMHVNPAELSNLFKGRENLNKFIKSMVLRAKKTVTIITSKDGLKRKARVLKSALKELENNGVKVNFYAEYDKDMLRKLPKGVVLNNYTAKSRFIIVDNSEMIFMPSDNDIKPEYDMGIWVKSPFFVNAFYSLFEESLK